MSHEQTIEIPMQQIYLYLVFKEIIPFSELNSWHAFWPLLELPLKRKFNSCGRLGKRAGRQSLPWIEKGGQASLYTLQ